MRLPVWLPACLLLAGCASAQGVPAWSTSWLPPADFTADPIPTAAPNPAAAAPLDRAILSLQQQGQGWGNQQGQGWGNQQGQGWGAPPSGPQGGPPPEPPKATGTKTASAPGKNDFSRKGAYLSVGFLSSAGEFDFERTDEAFDIPLVPNIDETTSVEGEGMSLRVGFRTSESFAFEILFDFASYDMTEETPGIEFDGTIDTFTLGFNGKVYIPVQRVEPYFLFGIGIGSAAVQSDYNNGTIFVSESASMTTMNLKFGLGMDIYAHRNFAIFLEWAMNMGFGFDYTSHSYVGVTSDIVFGAMFRF